MTKQKGFTMIELVVAMGVFLSLFLIVIVNFRSGESVNELRLETQKVASDIRKVQTLALTGSNYNGISMGIGGYGISFLEDNNNYIIFTDNVADGVYKEADDTLLETRTLVPNIQTLQIDSSYVALHIVFQPYSSNVSVYGIDGLGASTLQANTTSIYMTHLRAVGKTGIVSITPVSGRVDFEIQ